MTNEQDERHDPEGALLLMKTALGPWADMTTAPDADEETHELVRAINEERARRRVQIEAQGAKKKAAGRYTITEAVELLVAEAGERDEVMRRKLMDAASDGRLPMFEPGHLARLAYGPGDGLASRVRDFHEEAYWDDLNKWLQENEPRLKFRFPPPATDTVLERVRRAESACLSNIATAWGSMFGDAVSNYLEGHAKGEYLARELVHAVETGEVMVWDDIAKLERPYRPQAEASSVAKGLVRLRVLSVSRWLTARGLQGFGVEGAAQGVADTTMLPEDWLPYRLRLTFNLFELSCFIHREDPERLTAMLWDEWSARQPRNAALPSPDAFRALMDGASQLMLGDSQAATLTKLKKALGVVTMNAAIPRDEAARIVTGLGMVWPAELEPVASPTVAATTLETPDSAPRTQEDRGRMVKKAALIQDHCRTWQTIERDIKDAAENGLKDAAKADRRGWWHEGAALEWARVRGKLPPLAATAPTGLASFVHRMAG